MEQWKPVPQYEKQYHVSNLGRIQNVKTGQILKPWTSCGYQYVNLCKDGASKKHTIHRLVANAFIPNPQEKQCVNHIDGNKANNKVTNLEWCSYSENHKHAWDTGLRCMTETMKTSLIESKEKPVLCSNGKVYKSSKHAADELGLSKQGICNVLKGRSKSAGKYAFRYL